MFLVHCRCRCVWLLMCLLMCLLVIFLEHLACSLFASNVFLKMDFHTGLSRVSITSLARVGRVKCFASCLLGRHYFGAGTPRGTSGGENLSSENITYWFVKNFDGSLTTIAQTVAMMPKGMDASHVMRKPYAYLGNLRISITEISDRDEPPTQVEMLIHRQRKLKREHLGTLQLDQEPREWSVSLLRQDW